MHSYFGLLPLLVMPFTGAMRITRASTLFKVENNIFGPFEVGSPDTNITIKITPNKMYLELSEQLEIGIKGKEITHFISKAAHKTVSKKMYTVTFKLPLSTMLTDKGIYGHLCFVNSGNILETYDFELDPLVKRKIKPSDYYHSSYTNEHILGVLHLKGSSCPTSESFMFDGFTDFFNVDSYYRLSINDLTITYQSAKKTFPGCSASLSFIDYNNVFPYLQKSLSDRSFEIPLKCTLNGNLFSFSFPEVMYVNEKTLEMSLNSKPGFKATKYFYLPINRKEDLLDQVFKLEVQDFGYSKVSFTYDIRYTNNRSLIGDCNSSAYCVVGEMK